jgi:hypothetical protein
MITYTPDEARRIAVNIAKLGVKREAEADWR